MANLLVSDIQTMLAIRLGESAAPGDTTTKAQRLNWINRAYMDIARKRNWWWLETTDTSNTNTGSTTGYSEPADCKKIIELQISDVYYDEIPYVDNRIYKNTLGVVSLPTLRRSYKFYRYGGKYYLIPTDGNDAAIHYIKYYKRITNLTNDGDIFLIPEEYGEVIAAYAEARYWMSITQQAKASAPFQEYNQIVVDMMREHGRRSSGSAGFAVREPEDSFGR